MSPGVARAIEEGARSMNPEETRSIWKSRPASTWDEPR